MPADHPQPGIIHNDYRFDNVILDPDNPMQIIGVLDWEMATIGDPLMDLGNTWRIGLKRQILLQYK